MSEHEPRPFTINRDRRVRGEEQHNLSLSIPKARHRLEKLVTRIGNAEKPAMISYTDLDHDNVEHRTLDWDDVTIIDHALNKGEQLLAKEGVVFEPGYPPKGGETT